MRGNWTLGPAISATGWSAVNASSIDEAVKDGSDSTYAQSDTLSLGTAQTWTAPIVDPARPGKSIRLKAGRHVFTIRAKYNSGGARVRAVALYGDNGGEQTVGDSPWYAMPADFGDVTIEMTTTNICNRVRIEVFELPAGWMEYNGRLVYLGDDVASWEA